METYLMSVLDAHISTICYDRHNIPFRIVCGRKVKQLEEKTKREEEMNLSINRQRVIWRLVDLN